MLKFEKKSEPLLSNGKFLFRFLRYAGISFSFIGISLLGGMIGYRQYCDQDWITAFYSASMILTGMGPAGDHLSDPCMLFAGFYALYSGIAFLTSAGLIFAPILHRLMHLLHLDED